MPKTNSSTPQNLTRMNPGAAAIDIGSTMHMAAVNPDCADMPIRSFGTFAHDLHDLTGSVLRGNQHRRCNPGFEAPRVGGERLLSWRHGSEDRCMWPLSMLFQVASTLLGVKN